MAYTSITVVLATVSLLAGCSNQSASNSSLSEETAKDSKRESKVETPLAERLAPDETSVAPLGKSSDTIHGKFYYGDGLGLNLNLTIAEDQTFNCNWHGCLGAYGVCSGTWKRTDMEIEIAELESDGMFINDPLGNLEIGSSDGETILIKLNDRELFDQMGAKRYTCFHRIE